MSAGVINRFCPQRVRLSRRPGFRLRELYPGAVVVSRPSRFGNPWTVADMLAAHPNWTAAGAREFCAHMFRRWLDGDVRVQGDLAARRAWILDHLTDLTGKPLACWCPTPADGEIDHCHAAHLIHLANNTNHQGGNPDA